MIEIDIQLFLRHLIRKLLVPTNQSSYLICFCYNFLKIYIYMKYNRGDYVRKY